jgi:hypothetical protein
MRRAPDFSSSETDRSFHSEFIPDRPQCSLDLVGEPLALGEVVAKLLHKREPPRRFWVA